MRLWPQSEVKSARRLAPPFPAAGFSRNRFVFEFDDFDFYPVDPSSEVSLRGEIQTLLRKSGLDYEDGI
ncbi:hypothetical protein CWS72_10425, partial [Telmatospirillum siberiense]